MKNKITISVIQETYKKHRVLTIGELQTITIACELYQEELDKLEGNDIQDQIVSINN